MRIAILAPPQVPVPPPAYGGTEGVLDSLARGLEAAGHDVLLVATGDSSCPVRTSWYFDRAVGVGVGGPGEELKHVVHGYVQAERWGADVVHDHTLVGPLYAGNGGSEVAVVTTNHGPAYLFRNDGGNGNNWLRVKTVGTKSNRDGIGAVVRVQSASGKQWDLVRSGSSYC